jgi:hypothetical protein
VDLKPTSRTDEALCQRPLRRFRLVSGIRYGTANNRVAFNDGFWRKAAVHRKKRIRVRAE